VALRFSQPNILEHLCIPRFDPQNPLHQSLASLSRRAHELVAQGKASQEELRRVQEEIDHKAAELWGLSEEELEEIKRSLAEIS